MEVPKIWNSVVGKIPSIGTSAVGENKISGWRTGPTPKFPESALGGSKCRSLKFPKAQYLEMKIPVDRWTEMVLDLSSELVFGCFSEIKSKFFDSMIFRNIIFKKHQNTCLDSTKKRWITLTMAFREFQKQLENYNLRKIIKFRFDLTKTLKNKFTTQI